MKPHHSYSQVPQTFNVKDSIEGELGKSDNDPESERKQRLLSPAFLMVLINGLSLVFGIAIGASIISITKNQRETKQPNNVRPIAGTVAMIDGIGVPGTQCGDSWQEAKALGCHFDVMVSHWYAPECFDQTALEKMLDEQPYVNFTW